MRAERQQRFYGKLMSELERLSAKRLSARVMQEHHLKGHVAPKELGELDMEHFTPLDRLAMAYWFCTPTGAQVERRLEQGSTEEMMLAYSLRLVPRDVAARRLPVADRTERALLARYHGKLLSDSSQPATGPL